MTKVTTPDGRYFGIKGRLWRYTNPFLPYETKTALITDLMRARREKGAGMRTGDLVSRELARQRIDETKQQLGERGSVSWTDGAPDLNLHMAKNTLYAEWFANLPDES
jgi:hypothetical protein